MKIFEELESYFEAFCSHAFLYFWIALQNFFKGLDVDSEGQGVGFKKMFLKDKMWIKKKKNSEGQDMELKKNFWRTRRKF